MRLISAFILVACLGMATAAQQPDPALTVGQHLADYDFAVKYIEDNYAGFTCHVTDSTRADYESTKATLRDQVARGARTGWDAVAAYTGWFSDFHMVVMVYNGNPFEYFSRDFIIYPLLMEYRPAAVSRKVTDKTYLIRFPSCGGNPDMEWVTTSVEQFKASGCENLILDVRGNGGGSDYYFYPYRALLYDHEATTTGIEFRNTPQNMEYLRTMDWFDEVQREGLAHPQQEFIREGGDTIRHERDGHVRRAALLVDNATGSSGEEMVLQIKSCSDRVTVYGRDHTFGCLDYANVAVVNMPHSHLNFGVPMSRRVGLPENSVDKSGIVPDVAIDLPLPDKLTDNIDTWTEWVAGQLEERE